MLEFTRIILWSFQVVAFLFALFYFNKYKKTTQKYFLYFLAYVVLTEAVARILATQYKIESDTVFNIFTVVSILFYLTWFRLILNVKKTINVFIVVFLISVFFSVFLESFFKLWRISLTTGTILILLAAFLFYSDLINKIVVVNYLKLQKFWIVTGMLIFYFGFLPLQLFQPFIGIKDNIYLLAIFVLNIIQFGCYIKSFLCLKK